LQLDFGEQADEKGVVLIDAEPGKPAAAEFRALRSGRPLVTLSGSLEAVEAAATEVDDEAWIRVRLDMAARAGLADQVRDLHPGVIDVQLTRREDALGGKGKPSRSGRPPEQLFADYLVGRDVDDPAVLELFVDLLDEVSEAGP
jgi:exonuclease SbcD